MLQLRCFPGFLFLCIIYPILHQQGFLVVPLALALIVIVIVIVFVFLILVVVVILIVIVLVLMFAHLTLPIIEDHHGIIGHIGTFLFHVLSIQEGIL